MKKIFQIIKYFIPILIVIFIFGNSLKDGYASNASSTTITNIVNKVVKIDYSILNYIIRKLAHFTEFFLLGMFSYIAYKKISLIIVPVVAISDEIIQIFSNGRNPAILDIFVDVLGGYIAIAIIMLLILLRRKNERDNTLCRQGDKNEF